jgi:hypothetical protein
MDMHNRIWRAHRGVVRRLTLALAPLAVMCALGCTTAVATAVAGEYHVYSCRTPDGESAPTDGWTGSATEPNAIVEQTCSQPGGALVAGLRASKSRTVGLEIAKWTFTSLSDETIAGVRLWRSGDAEGGAFPHGSYVFWFAWPSPEERFGVCDNLAECETEQGNAAQPLTPVNLVAASSSHPGSSVFAAASCVGTPGEPCPNGPGDPSGYAAVVYIYAADITLEQTTGPTASDPAGELATAPTVSGTSHLAFQASDPGSGVYEAVFSIDGKVVQSTVLDENEGRCRNVGQTTDGLAAFLYVHPCPGSVNAYVGLDTTAVPNGEHHLMVEVTDAAGNSALVLERNITVDNPVPTGGPNGTNASAQASLTVGWKGAKGTLLERGYGRTETIVGRLSAPGGAPIGGARVDVLTTPDYTGARTAALPDVVTEADGEFTVRVPAGASSRTLRFAYSDELGGASVITRTLSLSVGAGVKLTVAPHTARAGSSIYFSGRLRGGPIPSGGKPLVLEARSPGGAWLEFDVIRSDARGRFHASYRFKFPGPADYQFRVLCEAEADYPYARGASNVVGVFER